MVLTYFCSKQNSNSNRSRIYQEHSEHLQEQQNDLAIAELEAKVQKLKEISIDLGDETKEQNKMLDKMVRAYSTFIAGSLLISIAQETS